MTKFYIRKRGRLLEKYHKELKNRCLDDFLNDKNLLNMLFDHYKRSMELHHKAETDEHNALQEYMESR